MRSPASMQVLPPGNVPGTGLYQSFSNPQEAAPNALFAVPLVAQALDANGLPIYVPPSPTLGQTAGGSLGAQTYYVRLTYNTPQPGQGQNANGSLNPNPGALPVPGEGPSSPENSFAVSANEVLVVTSPPQSQYAQLPNIGPTTYNVYVGTASGAETMQASGIPIGTNWTMPTSGLINPSNNIAPPAPLTVTFAQDGPRSNQQQGSNSAPSISFGGATTVAVDQNGNATAPSVTAGPTIGQLTVTATMNAPYVGRVVFSLSIVRLGVYSNVAAIAAAWSTFKTHQTQFLADLGSLIADLANIEQDRDSLYLLGAGDVSDWIGQYIKTARLGYQPRISASGGSPAQMVAVFAPDPAHTRDTTASVQPPISQTASGALAGLS